jgi:hypothetical protein
MKNIECLDTPYRLEYQRKLEKTKAVKVKLKRHHLEQELVKAKVGCVPEVIRFGHDDGNDDKSEDTAVIVAGTITGAH